LTLKRKRNAAKNSKRESVVRSVLEGRIKDKTPITRMLLIKKDYFSNPPAFKSSKTKFQLGHLL
jgi:hypothetical protein